MGGSDGEEKTRAHGPRHPAETWKHNLAGDTQDQPKQEENEELHSRSSLSEVLVHDTRGRPAGGHAHVPLLLDVLGAARGPSSVTSGAAGSSAGAARRSAAVVAEGRQDAVALGSGSLVIGRRGRRGWGGGRRDGFNSGVPVDAERPVAAADLGGVAGALEVAELALAVLDVVRFVAAAPAFHAVLRAEERVALALNRATLLSVFW